VINEFPARVTGGFGSGKTRVLRQVVDAHEPDRALVLCATTAAAAAFGPGATTVWGYATELLARQGRPVRILSSAEQVALCGDHETAETICHYQASFLGREELRTHADALGGDVRSQWEGLADAAESYLDRLSESGSVDWAGALVAACLLLRDDDVAAAERARFDVVVVDDFESASFATNRLLTQLVGHRGPIVVAGNPGNTVWRHIAGSPLYLDRFARRFGAAVDIELPTAHRHPSVIDAGRADMTILVEPGGDAWLAPDPAADTLPVALTTGLEWPTVRLVEGTPPAPHKTYDLHLLSGPDLPDDDERERRRVHEHRAQMALARSRATQTVIQPPSATGT
jgi:hypothetical protein